MLRKFAFPRLLALASLFLLGLQSSAASPAPARQDYRPKPAIWLLADDDTRIYLFGTIHVLPPGFKWRSSALNRVIRHADELVVEHYEEPGSTDFAAGMEKILLKEPVSILGRVPEDRKSALKAAIANSGIPAMAYDLLPTWLAAMMLGVGMIVNDYDLEKGEMPSGVEHVLEVQFRKAKKPILSVEDSDAVIAEVSALPEDEQRKILVAAIEDLSSTVVESDPGDRLWATGNPEALALDEEVGIPPLLYDLLLTKRNAAWTEWLIERLKKPGTALFAVGAAHLAGKDSVQRMLTARGFTVTRFD